MAWGQPGSESPPPAADGNDGGGRRATQRNATQRMERRAAQIGVGEGARSCYLFRRVHGKSILSPLLACWCPAHPERHSAAAPAALVSSGPQPPIVSLGQANRVASSYLSLPSFHLIHRLISYPLSLLSPPPSSAPPAHARAPAFLHDSPPRPRPRRLHLFRRRRKNGDRAFR